MVGDVGWRLLRHDDPPVDGPTNMAVDAALLGSVGAGAPPVVRLYRWDPPTLSFGRNQPAAGRYDEAAAARRGIAFVRRPTGGQAVLHDDELTYAVIAPIDAIGKPRTAYRRINEGLVAGLRRLGVGALLAGGTGTGTGGGDSDAHRHTHTHTERGRGAPPAVDWARACFRDPAEGEVVVSGRKLVGSAQRCEGGVVLQHGSILIAGSQATAEALLVDARRGKAGADALDAGGGPPPGAAGAAADPGWTTLAAELGRRPAWSELVGAVQAGFEETLGIALAPGSLTDEETTRVSNQRDRFASPEWTWRR